MKVTPESYIHIFARERHMHRFAGGEKMYRFDRQPQMYPFDGEPYMHLPLWAKMLLKTLQECRITNVVAGSGGTSITVRAWI